MVVQVIWKKCHIHKKSVAPPQNYREAPQNYREAPQNYREALQNYGEAPQNYREAPQKYAKPPHEKRAVTFCQFLNILYLCIRII